MTARDDNDELEGAFVKQPYVLHSIKVSKRMSLYEYVYVGAVQKSFQSNFTFSMKGHTSGLEQSQFQTYYKLHFRFLRFRKFRLVISSTRGLMFNSFSPCLHFVGRWQKVQFQIRRHMTKVASDQILTVVR